MGGCGDEGEREGEGGVSGCLEDALFKSAQDIPGWGGS